MNHSKKISLVLPAYNEAAVLPATVAELARWQPVEGTEIIEFIIVDDGIASGYTTMAVVESLRHRRPREIIVAVPVAPAGALEVVQGVANRVVTCAVGHQTRFYVSDYYRYWHEVDDNEAMQCLKEYRVRRYQKNIEPLPNGA